MSFKIAVWSCAHDRPFSPGLHRLLPSSLLKCKTLLEIALYQRSFAVGREVESFGDMIPDSHVLTVYTHKVHPKYVLYKETYDAASRILERARIQTCMTAQ